MSHADKSPAISPSQVGSTIDSAFAQAKRRRWPEWLLLFAAEALFLQTVPSAQARIVAAVGSILHLLLSLLGILDVRTWNLAGYIIALTIVLVILVGLKLWKDRVEWDADLKRWSSIRKRRD